MRSFKSFIKEEKPGLYANIHAKRARIKAGSGERMRKPGSEGAPSPQDFKDAAKTAKEEYSIDEAVSVKKQNYSWGKMVTVHHGSETSYPLHPEHQAKIKALGDGEKTSFKDETKRTVTAHRSGDTIHLSGAGSSKKTPVARSHFAEEVSPMIKAPKNEFATKADAFAHAKEKGGKVMKKTFTHPTSGQQHVSYVVKEEAELNELSRDTISSYKNKASDARLNKNLSTAKVDKRMSGVAKASARLDKKNIEEEQIDELSKSTLASYAKKAASDARFKQGIGKDAEALAKRKRDPGFKSNLNKMGLQYRMKAKSREAGVHKAIDRLAIEQKDDVPFTPDKPKAPSAKAGKYGIGYSTVKHLARMALAKQMKKQKEKSE